MTDTDLPLPCDQLTLAQGDAMKQFRLLKGLIRSFGIHLPVPNLPHAEDEEPDSFSYNLPASGFSLQFGIILWNEEERGPVATLNIWWNDGDGEPVIAVEYESDGSWYRRLDDFGSSGSLERVKALARSLEIRSPDIQDQCVTEMEAMNVADRLVKHYLKHRVK